MSAEDASPQINSRTALFIAASGGALLAIGLIIYFGISEVWDSLATASWRGILAIMCAYLSSLFFCAWSWRILLVEKFPQSRGLLFLWARWIRDSVGNLLAIVPGAGEAAGARELTKNGLKVNVAAATTIVDMTTEMLSQLIYTFMGLAFLFAYHPDQSAAWWAAGGLLVATIAVVGFLIAQRNGLILFLEALPAKLGFTRPWEGTSDAGSIHTAIQQIYRDKEAVAASIGLHLLGWLSGAVETWLALYFMGHQLSVGDVLALEKSRLRAEDGRLCRSLGGRRAGGRLCRYRRPVWPEPRRCARVVAAEARQRGHRRRPRSARLALHRRPALLAGPPRRVT
ncbi:MAG: lysylphosphatidylglycerol synthase domain-containing protein [Hyphomicrobium sp.]|uniref:lysylphosphatidylglycerol synthase domain-containing protein n=1 Tax=Hyphomicrobium sp. TaxID=82 RepID=UPI0039E245C6